MQCYKPHSSATNSFFSRFCLKTLFYHIHDDIIKWKHFPHYWPFVQGIYRSPVNSPLKGQWRKALMFSLICAWLNGWINNGEAGDLRRHRVHYDVTVMWTKVYLNAIQSAVPSNHHFTLCWPVINKKQIEASQITVNITAYLKIMFWKMGYFSRGPMSWFIVA